MIVVAIIALLLAILLPALGAMRRRARTAYCLNNLKHIGAALHLYAADNSDYTPPRYIGNPPNPAVHWAGPPNYPTFASAFWTDQILLGQYVGSTNGDNVHPQYIFNSVKPHSVFVCPSDTYHSPDSGGTVQSSYAMGTNFTRATEQNGYRNLWKTDKRDDPAAEIVSVDGFDSTFAPGGFTEPFSFLGAPDSLPSRSYNLQADPTSAYNWANRHDGTNAVFLDGSARHYQDLKPAYDRHEIQIHIVIE
jgi:type II secretory pathway pseudopilin PulG